MPADDLVLNVRQIAGYTPTSNAPTSAALLMQLAGLGSAYASISPAALVGTALAQGGDMAVGGQISALAIQGGAAQFSNGAFGLLGAQKACITNLTATFGSIGGVRIATVADVAALGAATVSSFNGRQGAVCLWIQDIISAGGAPNFSPVFGGEPRAPTPGPTSNSTRLATTAFVTSALGALTLGFAPLDSPNFTGVPTAPTAPLGSSDGTLATTAFVQNAIASSVAGVSSFNTRTGIVTLTNADVTAAGGAVLNSPAFTGTPTAPTPPPGDISTRIATTAFVLTESGFAPLASPAFTGIPTAPTATPGTNTTQLATTAYVQAAITGISLGVTTFNGRSGAVTLVTNDITAAGGAILASPAFTGTPTAPNPPPGDSSTRIATTAYVQSLAGFAPLASPAFTGVPTGPTAAPGNNSTQLATTAFVEAAIANSTAGVASFNGRTGAVTLQANDISAAGGALLASPAFTGTPSAPTAAVSTNTTQLATCAFVMAAIPAPATANPLMNGTAAPGASALYSRGDHVHPSDTTRAALTGAIFTGGVTANGLASNAQLTVATNATITGAATFNGAVTATGGLLRSNSMHVGPGSSIAQTQGVLVVDNNQGLALAVMSSANVASTTGMMVRSDRTDGSLMAFNFGVSTIVGSISTNGSTTTYSTTSDYRLKTTFGPANDQVGAMIDAVPVYDAEFTKTASRRSATPVVADHMLRYPMFLAHELQAACPWAVTGEKDAVDDEGAIKPQMADASKLVALLWAEIQNLRSRVATLENAA